MTDQQLLDTTLSFFDVQKNIRTDSDCKEVRLFNLYKPNGVIQACRLTRWTFLMRSKNYTEPDAIAELDPSIDVSEQDRRQYYTEATHQNKLYFYESKYYLDEDHTIEYTGTKFANYNTYKNFAFGFKLPNTMDVDDNGVPISYTSSSYTTRLYFNSTDGKYYSEPIYTTEYTGARYVKPDQYSFIRPMYVDGVQNKGFAIKGDEFYCNYISPRLDFISTDISKAPIDFWFLIAYRIALEICRFLDPNGKASETIKTNMALTLQTLVDCDNDNMRIENRPPTEFVV